MKTNRVMVLAELKELWKSSWYAWQGLISTPNQTKNAATFVVALNISSIIAPLVKTSREKKQLNGKEGMALEQETQSPLTTANASKSPQTEASEV